MNNLKNLSGYEIVAMGATKIEVTLPELGLKEIHPNRTWLEDKQVQAAIEARKNLIAVERIDKSGVLSHAQWNEELMLAEVTQIVGGNWQFLGHNVGKKLYLKPEEALFLLEINSLCLKHNDVKVSLQQAYTLLLRDKIKVLQYKVYASLSRLGYRVYRHHTPDHTICKQNINSSNHKQNVLEDVSEEKNQRNCVTSCNQIPSEKSEHFAEVQECVNEVLIENTQITPENIGDDLKKNLSSGNKDSEILPEASSSKVNKSQNLNQNFPISSNQMKRKISSLRKLQSRQSKSCNNDIIHKYFENMPELLKKDTVIVKTPDIKLLPNSIKLNKPVYKINLSNIEKKRNEPVSLETNIYSVNDEVNGSHIRRLRNNSIRTESNSNPTPTNIRFPNQNAQQRPYYFWSPRQPFNYCNVNPLFSRPFLPVWYFAPNFSFYGNPLFPPRTSNSRNINNRNRKRKRNKSGKKEHLDGILRLAARLKVLILNGSAQEENIYSLQRLIETYNTRYRTKLCLNETFNVVIDETIVDTIELEDDAGPSPKKRRTEDSFKENLNNLKLFAMRLKEMECNDNSSARHRRAFSKLLKTFNKSYNEDYYLNEDYEIVYRNQIDLDSSDSSNLDCTVEETPSSSAKKLKNPFSIIKKFSETHTGPHIDESPIGADNSTAGLNKKYSEVTLKTFTQNWLPKEDDFGRAEIISKKDANDIDIRREEFLYDFVKIQACKYDNWLDLKKSFINSIQSAIAEFKANMPSRGDKDINSIVKPEDCADMATVLKKLSVIKSEKGIAFDCNLSIDFDVYNRDVPNFRKSNRPTPNFRVICIEQSTNMPPGDVIQALHSKYSDQVPIVFAIVRIDAISYIQINPTDLPFYIPVNNT